MNDMNDHETERLQFSKDPAPFYSWTAFDKKSGRQVAKVHNHPSDGVFLQPSGRLSVDHVRDILTLMESCETPAAG